MIANLKELKAFLKLCRAEGVESVKFGNTEVFFRPGLPATVSRKAKKAMDLDALATTDDVKVPFPDLIDEPDELTDEQRLFGSADPSVWQKTN